MKKKKIAAAASLGLIIPALALTIVGIVRSSDDLARWAVYIGQAIACVSVLALG